MLHQPTHLPDAQSSHDYADFGDCYANLWKATAQ